MAIFYKSKFENRLKKYTTSQKVLIKFEIEKIAKDPYIGERKKGKLRDIYVHKFKLQEQLTLLAYRIERDKSITVYQIGPHEGFYKELERYVTTKT